MCAITYFYVLLYIGVAKGGGRQGARAPSNWNVTDDKNVTTSLLFVCLVSVFFGIFR